MRIGPEASAVVGNTPMVLFERLGNGIGKRQQILPRRLHKNGSYGEIVDSPDQRHDPEVAQHIESRCGESA